MQRALVIALLLAGCVTPSFAANNDRQKFDWDAAQSEPIAEEKRPTEPDHAARYLHNPAPHYPSEARRMGMEGRVVLHVEILQSGDAGRIEIRQSSGHDMLDQAAITAVAGWRFEPKRISGARITAWTDVSIRFKLSDR
jgi:protein TonB